MPFSYMEHKRRRCSSDNYVCEENKFKSSFVEGKQISYKTQCKFKANNYYFFPGVLTNQDAASLNKCK